MKICTSVLTLAFILSVSAPAFAKKQSCNDDPQQSGCYYKKDKGQDLKSKGKGKEEEDQRRKEDDK